MAWALLGHKFYIWLLIQLCTFYRSVGLNFCEIISVFNNYGFSMIVVLHALMIIVPCLTVNLSVFNNYGFSMIVVLHALMIIVPCLSKF